MQWLRDFFDINRRQEGGLWALVVLLISAIVVLYVYNSFVLVPQPYDKALQAQIDSLQWVQQQYKQPVASKKNAPKPLLLTPFVFDPNTVSEAALQQMGLPPRLVKQWVAYRAKGGYFRSAQDVSKLYAMQTAYLQALQPYMRFKKPAKAHGQQRVAQKQVSAPVSHQTAKAEDKEVVKPLHLGINTADSVALLQLRGIGPYYAGAIVRYRQRLGGYVDRRQLMDLYKVDSVRYKQWCKALYLDTVAVRSLSVNTATFKSLLRHPYIDYATTKYIVNKRRNLGAFAALYQLKDPQMMPDSLYHKLLPYLVL